MKLKNLIKISGIVQFSDTVHEQRDVHRSHSDLPGNNEEQNIQPQCEIESKHGEHLREDRTTVAGDKDVQNGSGPSYSGSQGLEARH